MKETGLYTSKELESLFNQMDKNIASNEPICSEKINLLPPKKPASLSAKVHDLADKSMSLSFWITIAGGAVFLAGVSTENPGISETGLTIFVGGGLDMVTSMLISQLTFRAKIEDVMKNIKKK